MSCVAKLLVVTVGITLLAMCRHGDGYSTGAPSSACRSMMPSHVGAQPRADQSPYVVTFNSDSSQSARPTVNGNRRGMHPLENIRADAIVSKFQFLPVPS